MKECCDICGDIGVSEAICTCSICKINCEHVYCMTNVLSEVPDKWDCEECVAKSKPKPPAPKVANPVEVRIGAEVLAESRILPNETRKGSSVNWEKKVETGKTKYICVTDAIKLSSGEKKSLSPSKVSSLSKLSQLKIGLNKPERTLMWPRSLTMNSSSQRRGNPETSKGPQQRSKKLAEVQRSMDRPQPSQAPTKKHVQKEQPAKVNLPQKKAKSLMELSYGSAPSRSAPLVTISGGKKCNTKRLGTSNAENDNSNLLPEALWKGSFCIQDDSRNGRRNHQIHAHPPLKVHRKLYDFSKQMPKVLDFQFVPFKEFWIDLFEDDIPDRRDIGLYFFPSDMERPEDYMSLLESISMKNLALRKQIDNVELLVFTSKLLHVDCQRLEGKYFLWGLFRSQKRQATSSPGLNSSVQPSQEVDGCDDVDLDMDMEMDMIGGVDVGRVDVVVQRVPLIEKEHTSIKQESITYSRGINSEEVDMDMEIDMIGGVDVGRIDVAVKREPLTFSRVVSFREERYGMESSRIYHLR